MGTAEVTTKYHVSVDLVVAVKADYDVNTSWLQNVVNAAIAKHPWRDSHEGELLVLEAWPEPLTEWKTLGKRLYTYKVRLPLPRTQSEAFGFRSWGKRVMFALADMLPPTEDFTGVDAVLNLREGLTFSTSPAKMYTPEGAGSRRH